MTERFANGTSPSAVCRGMPCLAVGMAADLSLTAYCFSPISYLISHISYLLILGLRRPPTCSIY